MTDPAGDDLLQVKVWGDFACFTRPEMKVERVSYPVITPSAARGVLEAIFWKPEFSWRIAEIWVLNPIRHFSIVRNEVNTRASARTARRWEREGGAFFVEDDRAQRHTLALRDVAYLIRGRQVILDEQEHPAKYRAQFERRVERGQFFSPPYLGCREFAAYFAPPDGTEEPVALTDDLGRMLFDLRYEADGTGTPGFFNARLQHGVLSVPQHLYDELASQGA